MISAGAESGVAVERALDEILARSAADPSAASTIAAADAARVMRVLGVMSLEQLAMLALPVARRLADPRISGYRVAAVGIEAETGDLLLGGNLEFPGTELPTTIHAEGFVALRARRRGRTLATIALQRAHPCAHCRQVLAESAAADDLVLIDPEGSRLRLADLYPWPFGPAALGMEGDAAGDHERRSLRIVGGAPGGGIAAALLAAGERAHAPYSGAPSAVALRTRDGRLVSAGCLESVAFNSSISAAQAALVELAATGIGRLEVMEAWLGCAADGAVDPEPGFRSLLGAVAPDAAIHVVRWRVG